MNDKNHEQRSADFPSHSKIGDCILAHLYHARRPLNAQELDRLTHKSLTDALLMIFALRRTSDAQNAVPNPPGIIT
jgi:hypothetical protein